MRTHTSTHIHTLHMHKHERAHIHTHTHTHTHTDTCIHAHAHTDTRQLVGCFLFSSLKCNWPHICSHTSRVCGSRSISDDKRLSKQNGTWLLHGTRPLCFPSFLHFLVCKRNNNVILVIIRVQGFILYGSVGLKSSSSVISMFLQSLYKVVVLQASTSVYAVQVVSESYFSTFQILTRSISTLTQVLGLSTLSISGYLALLTYSMD